MFFAFDLLYRDGKNLRPLPLAERKRRLVRLTDRVEIPCLHLVETFDDGVKRARGRRAARARGRGELPSSASLRQTTHRCHAYRFLKSNCRALETVHERLRGNRGDIERRGRDLRRRDDLLCRLRATRP